MPDIDLGLVKGSKGDKGDKGDTGNPGERGIQGVPGEAGKSAYQAAKDGGYTGTEAEFNAIMAIIERHAGRHKTGGADPLTAADVGAAPAGYGLGNVLAATMPGGDLNNAISNGWFIVSESSLNRPSAVKYGVLSVASRKNGETHQTLYGVGNTTDFIFDGTVLRRYLTHKGTWSAWEWENPPMELGKEYRTTERFEGKSVYAKRIKYGKGPSDGACNLHTGYPKNAMFVELNCKAVDSNGWGRFLNQYLSFGECATASQVSIVSLNNAGDLSTYDIYLDAKYYLREEDAE